MCCSLRIAGLCCSLTQATALTGSFKDKRALVSKQRHNVDVTIPNSLRPMLKATLTEPAQIRLARARQAPVPDFVKSYHEKAAAEAAPPPVAAPVDIADDTEED